jgi:hypothetical protein
MADKWLAISCDPVHRPPMLGDRVRVRDAAVAWDAGPNEGRRRLAGFLPRRVDAGFI